MTNVTIKGAGRTYCTNCGKGRQNHEVVEQSEDDDGLVAQIRCTNCEEHGVVTVEFADGPFGENTVTATGPFEVRE